MTDNPYQTDQMPDLPSSSGEPGNDISAEDTLNELEAADGKQDPDEEIFRDIDAALADRAQQGLSDDALDEIVRHPTVDLPDNETQPEPGSGDYDTLEDPDRTLTQEDIPTDPSQRTWSEDEIPTDPSIERIPTQPLDGS